MMAVLVVDDSLTVRMDLTEAFAAAGFQPVGCATLAAARAALAARRFALVVLDVLLPDGDGLALLAELKRRGGDAPPVLLLSTEAEVRDRVRGLETGADEYVGKPYDAAAVVARARQLVRRRDRGGAGAPPAPVLVVDDSLTVREALRGDLEAQGYEVVTAAGGEEALRAAADRRPAAVVVDGRMPGMDGAAFIRHLRDDAALRTTPCILLTASESFEEVGALEAGADAYVRKEEGHEVVLARLHALLRASSPPVAFSPGLLAPKRIVAVGPADARREDIGGWLREDGHEVVLADDVDAALALAALDGIDAVALVCGPDLAAALRGCGRIREAPALRNVPLLLVCDRDDHALALRALAAGADDCVLARGDVLRARVRALLRRKQFEDENRVRESYARNAAILETIADAFFAVDRDWRLVYVNHAFEELVGAPREELVGGPLGAGAAAKLAGLHDEVRRSAAAGAPRTFEMPFGEDRWLEVRAFPHEDGVSAHLRDVTERRRSQEVQAHLLGIVSHDLRTPLTSIRISVAGMTRTPDMDERQRRAIERIEAGAARMTRLIGDLLDYSRARLGQGLPMDPRPADLEAICADVLEAVRAAHPGRAVAYEHEGDGTGEWDPDRIHQVLVNLLNNALRHGDPERPVTLAWRGRHAEKVITVHNEGTPIDPRLLGHMFEPFTRAEPGGPTWGGVGLGLYIVKQIVVAHGGAVRVRSEERAGTTFEVTLPRSPPPAG